jgi:hypothetical protein
MAQQAIFCLLFTFANILTATIAFLLLPYTHLSGGTSETISQNMTTTSITTFADMISINNVHNVILILLVSIPVTFTGMFLFRSISNDSPEVHSDYNNRKGSDDYVQTRTTTPNTSNSLTSFLNPVNLLLGIGNNNNSRINTSLEPIHSINNIEMITSPSQISFHSLQNKTNQDLIHERLIAEQLKGIAIKKITLTDPFTLTGTDIPREGDIYVEDTHKLSRKEIALWYLHQQSSTPPDEATIEAEMERMSPNLEYRDDLVCSFVTKRSFCSRTIELQHQSFYSDPKFYHGEHSNSSDIKKAYGYRSSVLNTPDYLNRLAILHHCAVKNLGDSFYAGPGASSPSPGKAYTELIHTIPKDHFEKQRLEPILSLGDGILATKKISFATAKSLAALPLLSLDSIVSTEPDCYNMIKPEIRNNITQLGGPASLAWSLQVSAQITSATTPNLLSFFYTAAHLLTSIHRGIDTSGSLYDVFDQVWRLNRDFDGKSFQGRNTN